MGAVYRAYDERLQRDVAVKVLTRSAISDEGARRRFRREALTLSQINHPNIATIFDFDAQDGMDFLVLELIPGVTLESLIAKGPLPLSQFNALVLQLVQGLEAAHERGIVHRDLKPGNLQITPDGRLKILDFGLAVLRAGSSISATVTASGVGVIAGTLPYMAPEQLLVAVIDSRADIWAIGAVMYEMLTGRRAFPQRMPPEIMAAVLHQPIQPISGRVGKIVGRCLEKAASNRYQSVRDLRLDLEKLTSRNHARRRAANVRGVSGIAVLPLQIFSTDSEQRDFADGLTEVLITDLAQVSKLRVISRYSVMQYRDGTTPLARIARTLKIDAIVLGSILRVGETLRITIQLIDPATERHLWAATYESELSDILKVQAKIARAISNQVETRLTSTQEALLANRKTVNPVAYDRYLRGRVLCRRLNNENNLAGIQMLEQAIEIEPNFAPAHATLALAYIERLFLFEPNPVWAEQARSETEKALSQDSQSAEAHVARGRLLWTLQSNFPHLEAIREFRAAARINSSLDEAHTLLAVVYNHIGLLEEGLRAAQRATAINPGNLEANGHIVMSMLWSGRYAEAVQAGATLPKGDILPAFSGSQFAWGLARLGRKQEAERALDAALERDPLDTGGFVAAFRGLLRAEAGDEAGALANIEAASMKKSFGHFHHAAFFIACTYAQMRRTEEAVEWASYTAEHGFPCYPLFAVEPALDPVREEPRFVAWLSALKREWADYRATLFPPETVRAARGSGW